MWRLPRAFQERDFIRESREEDEAAIRAYGARILSLLESPWPFAEGKRNELDPRGLTLTPQAKNFWRDYFDHIEKQSGPGGELDGVKDFAAKSAEQAARIAGVLTIVADPGAVAIELREMESGALLADWHLQEAARLTTGARIDPRLSRASKMLTWLKTQGSEYLHLRRVLQFGPKSLRTKTLAVDAMNVLAEHGHVIHDPGRNAYRLRNAA